MAVIVHVIQTIYRGRILVQRVLTRSVRSRRIINYDDQLARKKLTNFIRGHQCNQKDEEHIRVIHP